MKVIEQSQLVIVDGTPFYIVSKNYKTKFDGSFSGIKNVIVSKETADKYLHTTFFNDQNIIIIDNLK